ncbi:hypothetical protein AGMMS50276_26970 [Synergistales bacterium]|nr:hypothetical protein AGMMS50276_26970 [Synergistales bacterium]
MRVSKPKMISPADVMRLIDSASEKVPDNKFTKRFLYSEWEQIIDSSQIKSWDEYRDVTRLGRKTRLSEAARKVLWSIFEPVIKEIDTLGLLTNSSLFARLAEHFGQANPENLPFDYIIVDEAQDIGIQQLRFLSAIAKGRENALFFAGDMGQRIFQQPFSWKSLGVDVRGRSKTLRVNYRTSHQIRKCADRLLEASVSDVDGNIERRDDAISVFNGPEPTIMLLDNEATEQKQVSDWIKGHIDRGIEPHEIGVFVRSESEINRALKAVESLDWPFVTLGNDIEVTSGSISLGIMHLAKGLEFKAVVVMACDDGILPLESRIAEIGDDSDLKEVYDTERQLFYVACTRARDDLLITGVKPGSEFIKDLKI